MAATAPMSDVPSVPAGSVSPLAISIKSPPPSPPKSRLVATPSVADVLATDGSVDVRLLMSSMWKHRANAPFTAELCQRLCSMPISQPMLDQVEFYLPQLAHMVVHLERELPMEAMEQFVLLLSQSSVHFALQFFWMIYAALDENRPKRAGNNPHTFARCAQLLLALEQCFVYGSPASRQASELLTRHSISKTEMEQILVADRRFFAAQQSTPDLVTSSGDTEVIAPLCGGWLFKKGGGTSTMGRRNWTLRWCRLEKRILLVFSKSSDSQPRTAIPLHGAEIRVIENKRRPFYFEVSHAFSDTKAKFAAQSAEELAIWVAQLQKTAALPEPPAGSPTKGSDSPERTLARMSFTMRSFLLQSASNVATGGDDSSVATPSRENSPSKTDSVSRPPEVTAEALAGHLEQMRTRMLSSGGASACSTLGAGDTEVSTSSTTDCCGSDALTQALLLPDQQRRYEFFCGMIHFVKSITDVSEALRRVEPSKRKALLQPQLEQLRLPRRAYIPLCKSTEPYCNVVSVFPNEGRVFSTHERAPCLIYFGTEESDDGDDVSTALFNELYDTRTRHVGDVTDDGEGEGDDNVTVFDEQAADVVAPIKRAKVPPTPRAEQFSRQMSPFLRELLADEMRKLRLEKTFGELTFSKAERLKANEESASSNRWRLSGLMAKSFDDLRQEVLVMQLIAYFQHIFELEKLPLRLHPYRILSTGSSTGLIEVVRNAMSLDGIKKTPGFKNLRSHFEQTYSDATEAGDGPELLRQAKLNFIHSLAAYSIVCYILAIKDRHNGNIMLDIEGYIIHIDFGFFLGRAPGGSFSFETAPFKLTAEMVDVLGGRHSSNFQYFTDLCVQGALAARRHAETIYTLVEVMSYHSKLPCFEAGVAGRLAGLRDRLFLNMPEEKVAVSIRSMVERSYDHFGTTKYDQFQVFSNGIAK